MLPESMIQPIEKKVVVIPNDGFLKDVGEVNKLIKKKVSVSDIPYMAFVLYLNYWDDSYSWDELEAGFRFGQGAEFILSYTTCLNIRNEDNLKGDYDLYYGAGDGVYLRNDVPFFMNEGLLNRIKEQLTDNFAGGADCREEVPDTKYSWSHRFPSLGVAVITHNDFLKDVVKGLDKSGLEYKVLE